ncbi:MAG: carbohydrate-binding domain-containing protein [Treponema sp.]|jgi:hypothetical protein|nr:carbohydrate-binding domain-containing protein [Treponema sp.]
MNRVVPGFVRVFCVALLSLLISCTAASAQAASTQTAPAQTAPTQTAPAQTVSGSPDFADTAKDRNVATSASALAINLADGASTTAARSGVAINNSTNTITITAPGTYALRGALSNGQVIVDVNGDLFLVLNGVSITSRTGAALAIFGSAKKVISLAAATANTLTDAASYSSFYQDDEPNAALFAKNDLTINGTGSLTVKGNYNNGIASKDELKIMSGVITVTAAGAALKGNDALIIRGGTITTNSTGDGLHSDVAILISGGTLSIATDDDGIHADESVQIEGGAINISKSKEGIEAAQVNISGGVIGIVSSDDGINAADGSGGNFPGMGGRAAGGRGGRAPNNAPAAPGLPPVSGAGTPATAIALTISGGIITVNSGGDGLDSNGSLFISGGTIIVHGPSNSGDSALDADGRIQISGGSLLAAGASRMAQAPDQSSSQPSITISFRTLRAAGSLISIKDSTGKTLAEYRALKSFQSLVVSLPALSTGASYSIYVDNVSAGTVRLSNMVTTVSL